MSNVIGYFVLRQKSDEQTLEQDLAQDLNSGRLPPNLLFTSDEADAELAGARETKGDFVKVAVSIEVVG